MHNLCIREEQIIETALNIVDGHLCQEKEVVVSASKAKQMATLKLSMYPFEVFAGLLLDSQLCVIKYIEFFKGTVNSCTVYPREVLRSCIAHNAQSIILMHNHPSGVATPSTSDKAITQAIVNALDYIDVEVRDHMVVAGNQCYSFAERRILPHARHS